MVKAKTTKTNTNIDRIIGIAADHSDVLEAVEKHKNTYGFDKLFAMQFALGQPHPGCYDASEGLEFDVEYKQCLIKLRDIAHEREVWFYENEEALALAAYVDAEVNRHAEYHAWLDGN
ncbi:hypothetical protein [Dongia deserti]|uniref:hypothetical protein n=1 Tax=Dongia deserti TaxID=2268030 RepID=UPI000E64C37B|nr:hypothetical protein [Dongia deserti]